MTSEGLGLVDGGVASKYNILDACAVHTGVGANFADKYRSIMICVSKAAPHGLCVLIHYPYSNTWRRRRLRAQATANGDCIVHDEPVMHCFVVIIMIVILLLAWFQDGPWWAYIVPII